MVFIADLGFAACLSIMAASVIKIAEDPSVGDWDTTTDTDPEPADKGAIIFMHVVLAIFNGLLKTLMNGLLKFIAICPCFQTNRCGNDCRSCWECIGHCLMCMWTCAVFLLLIIFILLAVHYGILVGFIISFVLCNIAGWVFAFCILSLCFKIQWRKEKLNKRNKLSKLKIHYIDYEKYEKGNMLEVALVQPIDEKDSETGMMLTGPSTQQQQVYVPPQPPQQVVVIQQQPYTQYVVNTQPLQPIQPQMIISQPHAQMQYVPIIQPQQQIQVSSGDK